jgi:hypothetical protein
MDDRTGLNDIDRAIADALDVEPSPEFAARVRQRIASAPAPASFWSGWRLAAAAAAVVAAIGIAMLSSRAPAPAPVQASRTPSVAPPRAVDVGPSPAPVTTAGSVPTPARRPRVPPQVARVTAEPEVLVPREEIEMYRRLIARAASAPRPVIVSTNDIVPPGAVSDITFDPIRIDLIVPLMSGEEGDRQ